MAAVSHDRKLASDVLKAVSRSFYLTLRLLPSGFREPASLGYLLARLSDTIADAGTVELTTRRELLGRLRGLLSAPGKRSDVQQFAQSLPGTLEGAGLSRGEWDLVLRCGDCFDWLEAVDRGVGKHVRKVVGTITEGQAWDLERFERAGVVRLETPEELELYAYRVAGCVGEFWTEIGFACEESFARESRQNLLEWGANYGKGLQLVNILRDVAEDLERGRCYLPGPESARPASLLEAAGEWRGRARELLADGFRYTASVRGVTLRAATGLPAVLGVKTLDRLEGAGWEELAHGVKVSRSQVRRALAGSLARSLPGVPGSWGGLYRQACQAGKS